MTGYQVAAFGSSRFLRERCSDAFEPESAARDFLHAVIVPIADPGECWRIVVRNPNDDRQWSFEARIVDMVPEYFVQLPAE